MAISQDKLEKILRDNFPDATIKVTDLVGDQDHYRLEIADRSFEGKSRVEQHKIINKVLNHELKGPLHALQIKILPLG